MDTRDLKTGDILEFRNNLFGIVMDFPIEKIAITSEKIIPKLDSSYVGFFAEESNYDIIKIFRTTEECFNTNDFELYENILKECLETKWELHDFPLNERVKNSTFKCIYDQHNLHCKKRRICEVLPKRSLKISLCCELPQYITSVDIGEKVVVQTINGDEYSGTVVSTWTINTDEEYDELIYGKNFGEPLDRIIGFITEVMW